jgi:hypothetical protein
MYFETQEPVEKPILTGCSKMPPAKGGTRLLPGKLT